MVKAKFNSKQLDDALIGMSGRASEYALGQALEKAGQPIADRARNTVHVISGDLRESLRVSRYFNDGRFIKVRVGTDIIYAAMEEFGGRIKITPKMRAYLHYIGIHPRATTTHVERQPHPYLRPAYEQVKGSALRILINELRDILT